ncbi:hypothetical protein AURDEDRAFT_175500 [Auricularia subglabra TFB-10046 SS5]|uniref:Uncharacterized protein n=1 Tax=Auricularia subglabra (strain TFB-10046 / SS5) TaxID=717982 RepID=J0WT50_AURST|nr:hypothetical protein AURDEDRAFT_175500 [Auricularia subglabra TFB-10046 SS5]
MASMANIGSDLAACTTLLTAFSEEFSGNAATSALLPDDWTSLVDATTSLLSGTQPEAERLAEGGREAVRLLKSYLIETTERARQLTSASNVVDASSDYVDRLEKLVPALRALPEDLAGPAAAQSCELAFDPSVHTTDKLTFVPTLACTYCKRMGQACVWDVLGERYQKCKTRHLACAIIVNGTTTKVADFVEARGDGFLTMPRAKGRVVRREPRPGERLSDVSREEMSLRLATHVGRVNCRLDALRRQFQVLKEQTQSLANDSELGLNEMAALLAIHMDLPDADEVASLIGDVIDSVNI